MSYDLVDSRVIEYRVNLTPHQIAEIDPTLISAYRARAVADCVAFVGEKPAIMLSGGIDSQFMTHCFSTIYPDLSPVILDYDGLNEPDVSAALAYCDALGLKPTVIKHPILWHLNRHILNFGLEHGLRSPQFVSHAIACENLGKLGYTGAVFGGNAFYKSDNVSNHYTAYGWVYTLTAAQILDLPTYGHNVNFPIISSFCSWSWPLALALAAFSVETVSTWEDRYRQKAFAYRQAGAVIQEQKHKYTGFEAVKDVIDASNSPGHFELKFRVPLYTKTPNPHHHHLALTSEQFAALDQVAEIFHESNNY